MAKEKEPVTTAIRALRAAKVPFTGYLYEYEEHGGTHRAAQELGFDEHAVVKTLIMENENKKPLIILMHGDLEVSTKELARQLKMKTVAPCTPETANKHSGYLVGGTSPFGTKHQMPIYIEKTLIDLPIIYINGGKRGYLVSLEPKDLIRVLNPTPVEVGIKI